MVTMALCDDNAQFLALLEDNIKQECANLRLKNFECNLLPCFTNAEDVLAYMKNHPIDVLFLDINLPSMSGFDLANILCQEHRETLIVFMSSEDHFVYDCFEFSPFAYLRKNCMAQELPRILARIAEKSLEPTKQIMLATKEGNLSCFIKDILYIESKHNYFVVNCLYGKSYTCRGTLSYVEDAVAQFNFYRVHSAFLVNLEYVDRIVENSFVLIKGQSVPVAQKRMVDFRKTYTAYTRRSLGE